MFQEVSLAAAYLIAFKRIRRANESLARRSFIELIESLEEEAHRTLAQYRDSVVGGRHSLLN